jgi:hypothetical protein
MLNSIILFVLKSIKRNIPDGKIFFVGSLANNEITIVQDNFGSKGTLVSDMDIIIFVDIPTFVKDRILRLSSKLAIALTHALQLRGHKTHVSIATFSYKLHRLIPSFFPLPNTIYQYEMARVMLNQNQYSISPIRFRITPSKSDCLDLIFSAIMEYVSVNLGLYEDITIQEKCYVLAKRCLTLLYSLLLFEEKNPRGYTSSAKLIKEHFDEFRDVIAYTDLEVLTILAKYKIQRDPRLLIEKLPLKEKTLDEALLFLFNFFEGLAERVLLYELNQYLDSCKNNAKDDSLFGLVEKYGTKSKISIARCLYLLLKYAVYLVVEKDFRKLKFRTISILSRRLEISSYIRYLVGKLFGLLTTSTNKDKAKLRGLASYTMNLWNLFMM